MKPTLERVVALGAVLTLVLAACSGGNTTAGDGQTFETIPATKAAAIIDDAPDGLVVLDVRTAQEFAEGHLPGAVNVDFYASDFADQLDQLDKDVPYVLYCRSGNRSGQTMPIMEQLGFREVHEIDGGIVSWYAEGLPLEQ